jgi:hypothetical protein
MRLKRLLKIIFSGVVIMAAVNEALAERHALLVGIDDYHIKPLAGPVNDVAAIRKILIEKWGFDENNITTLLNKQGTKKNILAAIERLYEKTQSSDEVFIYLSGHGTSAGDKNLKTPLPTTSGAFIPIDIAGIKTMKELINRLVIGRSDLLPLLKKFDKGNRHVFVVIDACYSGNTVRGAYGKKRLTKRFMNVGDILPARAFGDDLDMSASSDWGAEEKNVGNSYPYKNIYYLSASGEYEPAQDIPPSMVDSYPTIDGKSHGAFSDTLLRILNDDIEADVDGDGVVTYSELKKTVREKMRARGFNQTPQGLPSLAEDTGNLSSKSIFGDAPSGPPPTQVAQAVSETKVGTEAKIETEAKVATEGTNTPVAEVVKVATNAKPSSPEVESKPQIEIQPEPKIATNNGSTQIAGSEATQPQTSPQSSPLVDPEILQVEIDPYFKEVIEKVKNLEGVHIVNGHANLEVRREGDDALFISQAGDLILRLQTPTVETIVDKIRHQAWIHQLVEAPYKQDFNIDLDLYGSGRGSTAIENELIGFSVKSAHKAYILLIDIDPHGNVNVLYPYAPSEMAPIEANRLLPFKDLTRVTPPFGRDYLQAYAFTNINEDYEALRGKSFTLSSPYAENLQRLIKNSSITKARASLEVVTSAAN